MSVFFIASCDKEGGIYRYEFDRKNITEKQFVPLDRPMYLSIKNNKCYAVLRAPFGNDESGLVSFDLNTEGNLINKSDIISTKGVVGCHLAVTEREVFVANYLSGNVFKTPDITVTHSGKGVHSTRQEAPHTHCTIIAPDGKYICVADLGIDKIFVYDFNLNEVSSVKLPDGKGPRHIIFTEDGKTAYCVCELSNEIAVFNYLDGRLDYMTSVSTLPNEFNGENTAAAIRIKDEFIFVSNRGHNSIAVFEKNNKIPVFKSAFDCGGIGPRDFNIFENLLVCTNENSDDVTFFEICNGELRRLNIKLNLKTPLCVI